MAIARSRRASLPRAANARDRLEYRLLVALSFVLCLGVAAVRRLLSGGRAAEGSGRQSVIAEARSAAHAAVGYAFIA